MCRLLYSVFLIVIPICIDNSLACNGFKLRFNSVENCNGDTQIISIDNNFTALLTTACEVVTIGCVTSKGFTQAKIKYTISKNGAVIINGHPDVCDALDKKSEESKAKLEMFGFPTECPVAEGRRCFDGEKKLNITKYKNFLPMALGKMVINADIEHDTGKSCIKINFELYK